MSFKLLLDQVKLMAGNQTDRETALAAVCRLLHEELEGYDWVGFYLAVPGERMLELGPFAGEVTDHTRIPYGRGVCGQVAEREATLVISDVLEEANYLSCSVDVRSEIVVPVMAEGRFVAQLDIDSHQPGRFNREDRVFLEGVCEIIASLFG
jgi:L-methionine (R)-S-oxide reductase